jgi:hypothetical protein
VITLYLRGRVHHDRQSDLERFLADARPFYESPGGIRVRLQWDLADPCAFVEIMEYADRAAYDADQSRVEEARRWASGSPGGTSCSTDRSTSLPPRSQPSRGELPSGVAL